MESLFPPTFLAGITAVGIALAFMGVALAVVAASPVRARLSRLNERVRTLEEIELDQPFSDRVLRPVVMQMSRLISRLTPSNRSGPAEQPVGPTGFNKKLLLAGSPNNLTANEFIGIIGMSMLGFAGIIFLLLGVTGTDLGTAAMFSLGGAALGYLVPSLWLSGKISSRRTEIQRAMPDVIDLLVISVEAGVSFDAAAARLGEKADNALVREFRRVMAEMLMGRPRREAMRDMLNRADVPDLNRFIAAIVQAEQLGVSVAKVLTVQADQMRVLRRQRAEEQAAKAPLKMLFPMIGLIFPALFIVILGPTVPKIFGGGAF